MAATASSRVTHAAEWQAFSAALRRRLVAGERLYGERSFRRPCRALAREVEEELLDVCGWAFILWCRLRALQLPGRASVRRGATERVDGR